jgi:hypothetical protein
MVLITDEMLMLSFITIFNAFFSGLYVYFIRNFNFWKKLGIPYVKPVPFVGNFKELVFLKLGIGHYLQKIYEEHKDMSYVGILSFSQQSLVIRYLDLVKKIVVKDAYNFMDRVVSIDYTVEPVGGKTLFSMKGQRWRNITVNLTPVFTSGNMKKMFLLVDNCAKELVQYLDRVIPEGKPFSSSGEEDVSLVTSYHHMQLFEDVSNLH